MKSLFQNVLDLRGGKQVLDVLGDSRWDAAPFAKAFPNLHTPGANLAAQQKVELVHIVPGGLALASIHRDAVPYLILNDQHPKIF